MSLSPRALTTVSAARRFVFRKADDDSHDEDLEDGINQWSDAIRAYTRREWRPVSGTAIRTFDYDGSGVLDLTPYDLRAVQSIALFTDLPTSSHRTLTTGGTTVEGEYRLPPPHPLLGTYGSIYLPDTRQTGVSLTWLSADWDSGSPRYQVTVTGSWGIADTIDDVPYDVQRACLIAVKDGYVNPEGYERRELGELNISEAPEVVGPSDTEAGSLPPDARRLLGPYRRSRPIPLGT